MEEGWTFLPRGGDWSVSGGCIPHGTDDTWVERRRWWGYRNGPYTYRWPWSTDEPDHWPSGLPAVAEWWCGLCSLAWHGVTADMARAAAMSDRFRSVRPVVTDLWGEPRPAARCGGNGALIDLSCRRPYYRGARTDSRK